MSHDQKLPKDLHATNVRFKISIAYSTNGNSIKYSYVVMSEFHLRLLSKHTKSYYNAYTIYKEKLYLTMFDC